MIATPLRNFAAWTLTLTAALAPAAAYAGATVTGPASAEVLEEIQFAVLLDMDFGRIAVNGAGGVVELDPASNNRMCDGTLICTGSFAVSQLHLTGGARTVKFGARLHINPLQAPGVYSGDFSIDLEYH